MLIMFSLFRDYTEEELEEHFKRRYESRPPVAADDHDEFYDDITQQGLLPSTK